MEIFLYVIYIYLGVAVAFGGYEAVSLHARFPIGQTISQAVTCGVFWPFILSLRLIMLLLSVIFK